MEEAVARAERDYPPDVREFVVNLLTHGTVLTAMNRKAVRGWKYGSYEELILDVGQVWTGVRNLPDDVEPMEIGNCYENAGLMAMDDPDRWTFVEGKAQSEFLAVSHAWLLDNYTGQIVDPTWASIPWPRTGVRFYAGIPFAPEEMVRRWLATGSYSVLSEDWMTQNSALHYGLEMQDGQAIGGRIDPNLRSTK